MPEPAVGRSVRIVPSEIQSGAVTTRLLLPTERVPAWRPFRRISESVAGRARQLPTHAHEHEEVLTYVTEGFASYQVEGSPSESLVQGSARLLTTAGKASHRVSAAQGAAIRWFSLVVDLPRAFGGETRLQSVPAGAAPAEVDNACVRRLVGPDGPMVSGSGLDCYELAFPEGSTTFARVGRDRRAVLYALAGHGTVDDQGIDAGEAALAEGVPALSVQGRAGFRAILATAPAEGRPPGTPESRERP